MNALNSKVEKIRVTTLKTLEIEGLKSIRKNFEAEGRPDKWLPKKIPDGRKILRGVTNSLFNSTVAIADFASNKVELGSNVSYSSVHEKGGIIKHGKGVIRIPARPRLVIPTEDFSRICKSVIRANKL